MADDRVERRREARLWIGFLLPPAAWAAALLVSYAVVAVTCSLLWTAVVTVLATAAAALGTWLAFREHRALRDEDASSLDRVSLAAVPYDYHAGTHARQRLMSKVGMVLGVLMVIATVGHGFTAMILGCR